MWTIPVTTNKNFKVITWGKELNKSLKYQTSHINFTRKKTKKNDIFYNNSRIYKKGCNNPTNTYLFKFNNVNTRKIVKFVQSWPSKCQLGNSSGYISTLYSKRSSAVRGWSLKMILYMMMHMTFDKNGRNIALTFWSLAW